MTRKPYNAPKIVSKIFPVVEMPATEKSKLPVTVIEATAYAFNPDSINVKKREELDLLYNTNHYFKRKVNDLRKKSEYFKNIECAP